MTPLTDLGSGQYLGFAGGLYPTGKNSPPSAYLDAGVALGATVQPVGRDGKPSISGKIVMISIGMSNTSRQFSQFIRLAGADARKNPSLLMIDAARNGAAATQIAVPFGDYWIHVDRQLQRCEVSPAQVHVAWLKAALDVALDRGNSQYEVSAAETCIRLQPDLWRLFGNGFESGTHRV
jgi:hypothetical protein